VQSRIDLNRFLPATFCNHTSQKRNPTIRPVAFGEALSAGTRLTLFSDDKPDRFFTVIKFWIDETSGIALALKTGVPTYQVEDEEGVSGVRAAARAEHRNGSSISDRVDDNQVSACQHANWQVPSVPAYHLRLQLSNIKIAKEGQGIKH
jgi:hypothetical protein